MGRLHALSRRQFMQAAGVAGRGLLAGCGRLPGQAQPDEFEPAFAVVDQQPADALMVFAEDLTASHAGKVVGLVTKSGLPAMYEAQPFMDAGGLMAYGPSVAGLFRRAAYYVDRILKGAKPADLPIEQPTTFDLVINLKMAQALGLAIPQHVLRQATELIQ
jgi:putative ABC transport system substrate-binding protein